MNENEKKQIWGVEADLSGITPPGVPTQFVPVMIRPFIADLLDANKKGREDIAVLQAKARDADEKIAEYKQQLEIKVDEVLELRGRIGEALKTDDAEESEMLYPFEKNEG